MALFGRSISIQAREARLAAGIAAFLLSNAAGWWLQVAPGESGVSGMVGSGPGARFDAVASAADLREFVGDGTPRVAGTPGAAAGRDRLARLFGTLGLQVERQAAHVERRAGSVDLENLVIRVPGARPGAPRVAVVAHSDSVPGAPGASDDGAGVACAVGIARALVAEQPEHDVLVVITDGEERGLLGAEVFMAQHPLAKGLRAVVNMDARGAAGPAFVFETGPETAWLADLLARRVDAPRTSSLMGVVYGAMPNGTDFTVFLRAGVSGFNIAFLGDMAAYHTGLDTVERQSPASRAHMGRTALALVRGLDEELPEGSMPAERAVFGDVLGLGVVRWPEPWTPAIAVCSALAIGAAAAWNVLRGSRPISAPGTRAVGRAPGRASAEALAASMVALVLAALIGWGFGAACRAGGLTMANAGVRLHALDGVLQLGAVLAACGAGAWLGRRGVDPWSTLLGAWVPWIAAACAAAFTLPAASFLFVVPVAVMGAAAVIASVASRANGSVTDTRVVAFAGLAAAAVVWIPLEPAFVDALGFQFGWLNGVRMGLLAVTFVPLVAGLGPRRNNTP